MIYDDLKSMELFPIDGLVIKSEQENSLAKYGRTEHHPSNAYAWKAIQEAVETTLINVDWQVGR